MSDASKREWRFYIDDMIDFAEKVLAYTEDLDQTGYEMSGMTYDATLRNLALIGEAANHIPHEARAAHPESLGIDNDTLWSIIQDDVPELLPMLKSLETDITHS